jgi:hypothetical protein
LALLLATAAGLALARRLDRGATGALLIGEGILLGIGAAAAVLLLSSIVGMPWTRIVVLLALTAIAATVRLRGPWLDANRFSPFDLVTLVCLAGYARFATMAPLWEFDYIGGFGLKARMFWEAHAVDWRFLQSTVYLGVHPDYPPLLPLSFDFLALARGAWDDWAHGLLNVAFALALLLVIRHVAGEDTGSKHAAAFVAAAMLPLAASPWIGLAEGPLVAFGTTALLLLRRGSVAAGAVMLGLGALTKNEGLTLIVAVAAGLAAAKRLRDVPRLWPAVAIPLPWLVLRQLHHFQSDLTEGNVAARIVEHLRNPRPLLDALAAYQPGRPLFWIALAIGIALVIRPLLARERFVVVAIAAQFVIYIVAYLATPHDVMWQVRWSWERLISHLTPALAYVVLVNLLPDNHAAA